MMPMGMPAMNHTPGTTTHIVNFLSLHPVDVYFLMCDGAVRFLAKNMNWDIFHFLGDKQDDEIIGRF